MFIFTENKLFQLGKMSFWEHCFKLFRIITKACASCEHTDAITDNGL